MSGPLEAVRQEPSRPSRARLAAYPDPLVPAAPARGPEPGPAFAERARNFVAASPAMAGVLREVLLHAASRKPLLLVGATGTGKTTVAELVHAASGRTGGFFAHTAGEPDPNLERSDLFGHERGAFTGATTRRVGWLEEAGGGTLLLDDVHHMRLETQKLLLRALDRKRFRRVGAVRDLELQCRVILGFGERPDVLVREGRLLRELFYRLGFSWICLPSLVERREDIVALADSFLKQAPQETGLADGPSRFAAGVVGMLEAGDYPGNVRELRQIVEAAYERARGEGEIREEHLPEHARVRLEYRRWGSRVDNRRAVEWALGKAGGDVGRAAALLGVHRNTVGRVRGELRRH